MELTNKLGADAVIDSQRFEDWKQKSNFLEEGLGRYL
jgi:hypothetical protein